MNDNKPFFTNAGLCALVAVIVPTVTTGSVETTVMATFRARRVGIGRVGGVRGWESTCDAETGQQSQGEGNRTHDDDWC